MSVLPVGFGSSGGGGVDVGDIGHSLRCRSAASAYLSKTPAGAGSQTTWTMSLWVKRGVLGALQMVFSSGTSGVFYLTFQADNTLKIRGSTIEYITTATYRDPTAAMHIVLAWDSSNGTAGDRARLYINGSEVTSFSTETHASASEASEWNKAQAHNIARYAFNGTAHLDGYLSRIAFVDGTALTPSSFGSLNTEINEWVTKSQSAVKAVVDAGGTNSFMLDFDDATSLTTLGNDFSTKNNDWTLNNFSLTAGSTYDHMLDVPGNSYATLNAIYPSAASITNGNLSSGTTAARGTLNSTAINSQWFVTAGASAVTAGVIDDSGTVSSTSVTANKVFAFKMTTAGALSYKNVTDAGSWTSIATGLTGNRWPYSVTQAASWNFGQQPLPEALDTGFLALCQANLPTPAILNPSLYFDAKTRTGTGAAFNVTGQSFQPDLVESKSRSAATDWAYYDSVRGVQKQLESNTATAETTEATGLTAFNADGFSGGALAQLNTNAATYIDYMWKMGGAAVSNTNGSITSSVSANTLAGQSVVAYTSPNAAPDQTVGHGLLSAPQLIIVKNRVSAVLNWDIYHNALTAGNGLVFTAAAASASRWPTTAPTSSVFSTKNTYEHNSTDTYVAYCFHSVEGYSKVFSYTGNGSADGPYVHLGFKPRWILTKCSSTAGNSWIIYDTVRDTYNVVSHSLMAESSAAENGVSSSSENTIDITALGFKCRTGNAQNNQSGQTYIGIAFAEVAGKFSLGR